MHDDEQLDPTPNTREWIELKLNGLRSEMRMLFVLSVAGNQLLGHLALSPTLGYVSNGLIVGAALAAKGLALWR